jgi:hypothetical protein
MQEFLQIANLLVVPAFGYIIILERRITKLQMQVEMLLERLTEGRPATNGRDREYLARQ